jgi:hypothetical protein
MTCITIKPVNEFMPAVARAASGCLSNRMLITTWSQAGSSRLKERGQASFLPNLTGYFWQCAARERKRPQSASLHPSISFSIICSAPWKEEVISTISRQRTLDDSDCLERSVCSLQQYPFGTVSRDTWSTSLIGVSSVHRQIRRSGTTLGLSKAQRTAHAGKRGTLSQLTRWLKHWNAPPPDATPR